MVAGREASCDEGGRARGETQRDQDRVTQLSQTQGESLTELLNSHRLMVSL